MLASGNHSYEKCMFQEIITRIVRQKNKDISKKVYVDNFTSILVAKIGEIFVILWLTYASLVSQYNHAYSVVKNWVVVGACHGKPAITTDKNRA
jgi:hypothetical protein